jgi:hypothetical protein
MDFKIDCKSFLLAPRRCACQSGRCPVRSEVAYGLEAGAVNK